MKSKLFKLSSFIIIFSSLWVSAYNLISFKQKVKGITTNVSSSEIIAITNLVRLSQDIPTLTPNSTLEKAAIAKAQHMVDQGYFDHKDNNGVGVEQFIDQNEYTYHFAGENLARNFYSSEDVIDAWVLSEEHKNNILNPNYQDIGVAVLESGGEVYIVQLFGSKIPSDLIDQSANFQKDFIYTTPISGRRSLNPNIALTMLSLFITIATISIAIIMFKLLKNQHQPFKSPEISHWKK